MASRIIPITLPELGSAARFSLWFVLPGDRVYEGDRVAEVLVPGATFDVAAPATGIFVERNAAANEPLAVGQVLGTILADPDAMETR